MCICVLRAQVPTTETHPVLRGSCYPTHGAPSYCGACKFQDCRTVEDCEAFCNADPDCVGFTFLKGGHHEFRCFKKRGHVSVTAGADDPSDPWEFYPPPQPTREECN